MQMEVELSLRFTNFCQEILGGRKCLLSPIIKLFALIGTYSCENWFFVVLCFLIM